MRELIAATVGANCLLESSTTAQYAVRADQPAAVVAPRSAEEAAAVLELASREGFPVECAGTGTRLDSGNRGKHPFIALCTRRLNAVTEYEPADLVISTGAGVSFPQLHGATSPHNQFLALDPPVSPGSTIGAAIATAAAGPLRYGHGTPRDHVLGLEIVTGDGRILNVGGKVVKNVAGYDLVRLMVGSRGTLGFITSANVRLKPIPQVDRTLLVRGTTLDEAAEVVDAIMATTLEPVALEILSPSLAATVTGEHSWALLVRYHGNEASLADAEERTRAATARMTVLVIENSVWRALAESETAAALKLRFANVTADTRSTIAGAQRTSDAAGLADVQMAVHAGDGIVRVFASAAPARAGTVLLRERAALEAMGGTLIIERSLPDMSVEAFGNTAAGALMAGIKNVFDPAGILAPGRFVL